MTANGFLEQRTARPLSLGAVVLLHGAAIAAVLLLKGPGWVGVSDPPLVVTDVKLRPPPPPEVPPPPQDQLTPQVPTISRLDIPRRVIPTPVPNLPLSGHETSEPSGPIVGEISGPAGGTGEAVREAVAEVPIREVRPILRVDAQFDPRFAGAMQPPYPAIEQRNEREGQVRVRVTIAPDGRVAAVQKVSATSDAFWQVTQRQALGRWRFKPATVDGKPVESSKVLSVFFKLSGQS